jgi:hypothetical protein
MGFLNKAFRKGMKKQVAQMPRRGGGFGNLGEVMRRMQEQGGMPQPIARRDPSALERLPMGNMPDFSQIDMSQLDLSGIPQSISQMDLPQMPEGLPSIEEIQGNQRMPQMGRGRMQPRMMMAEGDEVMMMQENEMMAPNGGEIEMRHAKRNGLWRTRSNGRVRADGSRNGDD